MHLVLSNCPQLMHLVLSHCPQLMPLVLSNCPQLVHDLALIVLAMKSACNFILYCWFSEKFLTTFKQIFCLRHCLPEQPLVHNGHNGCQRNSHNSQRASCFVTRETTC